MPAAPVIAVFKPLSCLEMSEIPLCSGTSYKATSYISWLKIQEIQGPFDSRLVSLFKCNYYQTA